MSVNKIAWFAKETYSRWSDHHAPRLGASVAFYSILSFAPLLLLVTAVMALFFGHESAQGALVNQAKQLIGDRGAETANTLLKNAQRPTSGAFASLVAFITLLFGASGVFTELQDALNIMWDAPKQTTSGLKAMLKERLFSFGMVLSVGFLLLVSLILSTVLAYLGRGFGNLVPLPPPVLESVNFAVSLAVVAVLFALMFKYVPKVEIALRDVIVGAIVTALLFVIGKLALGIYLGKASVGSTYGAAGSVIAVVVWIYYSAQIFFFGAEFTRIYADAKKKPATTTQEKRSAAATTSVPQQVQTAERVHSGRVLMPVARQSVTGVSAPALPSGVVQTLQTPAPVFRKRENYLLLLLLAFGFLVGRASTGSYGKRDFRS